MSQFIQFRRNQANAADKLQLPTDGIISISAANKLNLTGNDTITLNKGTGNVDTVFSVGTEFGKFDFATANTLKLIASDGYTTLFQNSKDSTTGNFFGTYIDYDKTGNHSTGTSLLYNLYVEASCLSHTGGTTKLYGIWNNTKLEYASDAVTHSITGLYNNVYGHTN